MKIPIVSPFERFKYNIHSQNGEDGILQELFHRLNIGDNGCMIEFGAWDGKHLSNTYAILERLSGFRVLYIEGDTTRYQDLLKTAAEFPGRVMPVNSFVQVQGEDSLNNILKEKHFPQEFELLSIDIDSYDYQIWESLEGYSPKIVVIEIESTISPDVEQIHSEKSNGSSFLSMLKLGQRKGYTLVCHTGNMIFIRNDLVYKLSIEQIFIDQPELLFNRSWLPKESVVTEAPQAASVNHKVILVNYGTENFYGSQAILNVSAIRHGADYTVSWTPESLYSKYPKFYQQFKEILDQPRGAGYWLWKPFLILEAMSKANEGDIIIYFDSTIEVVGNLQPLLDICRKSAEGIVLFGITGNQNKAWTKRDCFSFMNCDTERYWDAPQVNAALQIYRKNEKSWNFVSEYFHYCQKLNIITDAPNVSGLDNFPSFQDHRHDQSVLSILAEKYNIEQYRDPSQWSNHEKMPQIRREGEWLANTGYTEKYYTNSQYDTLLNHHRKRLRIVNQ